MSDGQGPGVSLEVKGPPASIPPEDSKLAEREASAFGNKNLDQQATTNKFNRQQDLRSLLHWCTKALIVFMALLFGWTALVYAFHLLTPWGFLPAEQLDAIKGLLVGAAASTIVSGFLKRIAVVSDDELK